MTLYAQWQKEPENLGTVLPLLWLLAAALTTTAAVKIYILVKLLLKKANKGGRKDETR